MAPERTTRGSTTITTRLLQPSDLDPLYALHRRIRRTLPHPAMLYSRSREFFARILGGEGRVVAACADQLLVAYATLHLPGQASADWGRELAIPPDQLASLCRLDGAAVDPAYRGHHLHQHLAVRRIRLGRLHGCRHFSAIVSPFSPFSLRSHLSLGLRVRRIKTDQDGPNFLLHLDVATETATPSRPDETIRIDDFRTHLAALSRGLCGYRLNRRSDGFFLDYGPDPARGGATCS